MKRRIIIQTTLIIGTVLLGTSCETISEDQCFAANWADRGYRDGANGSSRSKLNDYIEACQEYGADVDRSRYLDGYESGLVRYCTYDKGFSRGEGGNSYNSVCEGPRASDFRAGYEDGRAKYDFEKRYDDLLDGVRDKKEQVSDLKGRLKDVTLSAEERFRLEKKLRRYTDRLKDARWELQKFERKRGY